MTKPTIACCLPVHNDLRFLRCTLPYEMKWADQIVILDMASTDGTKEYCEMMLRRQDVYVRRETNTCPELGFGEASQAAADAAYTDWVYYGGADQMLDLHKSEKWPLDMIEELPTGLAYPVLNVQTVNVQPGLRFEPECLERVILNGSFEVKRESHRRIVRRDSGIVMKGYIHEELYKGETNAISFAIDSGLSMWHFSNWQNSELRSWRYSWMLRNAIRNPELQKYTNRWWYDTYYPQNQASIEANAAKYEEYVAKTGDR